MDEFDKMLADAEPTERERALAVHIEAAIFRILASQRKGGGTATEIELVANGFARKALHEELPAVEGLGGIIQEFRNLAGWADVYCRDGHGRSRVAEKMYEILQKHGL